MYCSNITCLRRNIHPDSHIKPTSHSACDYKHVLISNVSAPLPCLSIGTETLRELYWINVSLSRQQPQYSPPLWFQFGARLETSFFSCLHGEWLSLGTLHLFCECTQGLWVLKTGVVLTVSSVFTVITRQLISIVQMYSCTKWHHTMHISFVVHIDKGMGGDGGPG